MPQVHKVDSEDIDGFKYRVARLPPRIADDILTEITNASSSILALLDLKKEGDDLRIAKDAGVSVDGISEAVQKFFKLLPQEKKWRIIARLAEVTEVIYDEDKTPQLSKIFDDHFHGRLAAMYRWVWFALGVQYADFLDWLKDAIGALNEETKATRPTSSSSQTTSLATVGSGG